MKIEIVTENQDLVRLLREAAERPEDHLPNGVVLGGLSAAENRLNGVDPAQVVAFILGVGATVSVNLLSAWLYDKAKSGRRLRIEDREVSLTLQEIQTALLEHVRRK